MGKGKKKNAKGKEKKASVQAASKPADEGSQDLTPSTDRRSVTAYLPLDLYNRLRREAFEGHCSMTSVVIEALNAHLHCEGER